MEELPPMHQAAKEGDLDRVRQLMEEGVSVDSRDVRGFTPLHWAASEGRHAVAELLISSKCDPNLKDRHGSTPVLLAAHSLDQSIVTLLLQNGARGNCCKNGSKPLFYLACRYGWTDIVRHLIDEGADLNAATLNWATLLLMAVRMELDDVAVLLIRAGADVNRRGEWKMTALHWAAEDGRTRVVQELLKIRGLDLNPRDVGGNTPLYLACIHGRREVVKQLLAAGADTTYEGETVLSVGIREEEMPSEFIKLFVQHGAFLQDCDYVAISQDPDLKESVLKDVDLCTQSIVNKFHHQSLPALKSISYFARKLPNVDTFKLNARQINEVENLVRCEIRRNSFCNVAKAHPMALSALCVLSLITCQSVPKRSASPDLGDVNFDIPDMPNTDCPTATIHPHKSNPKTRSGRIIKKPRYLNNYVCQ